MDVIVWEAVGVELDGDDAWGRGGRAVDDEGVGCRGESEW